MLKFKVVLEDQYRDGGTIVYRDELNRLYFQWFPTKKVYNQSPFPKGFIGALDVPAEYIQEIPVELEIVETF